MLIEPEKRGLVVPEAKDLTYEFFTTDHDLLRIVSGKFDISDIEAKIGEDPQGWIDELDLISRMLGAQGISAGYGFLALPLKDNDTEQIGEGVYISRSPNTRVRGLWRYTPENSLEPGENDAWSWAHYKLGSRVEVGVVEGFQGAQSQLVPDFFDQYSELVSDRFREVRKGEITVRDESIAVYSKGSTVIESRYYQKPKYRLTNIAQITNHSPRRELDIFRELSERGVAVPKFVGLSRSEYEQRVYYEEAVGLSPEEYFETHRDEIIIQDARILAALALMGFRKFGFDSFDDKIFDGETLYLIDADEVEDLYKNSISPKALMIEFLDPNDESGLERLRELQRQILTQLLRDAISDYSKNLTPSRENRELYVRSFFQNIGWGEPTDEDLAYFANIPDDYLTHDREVFLMSDSE